MFSRVVKQFKATLVKALNDGSIKYFRDEESERLRRYLNDGKQSGIIHIDITKSYLYFYIVGDVQPTLNYLQGSCFAIQDVSTNIDACIVRIAGTNAVRLVFAADYTMKES